MNNSSQKTGAIIIEGHVQGLANIRSLGKAGIPVYVIDKVNCVARYSKYTKKFFICPDFQKDEFADYLIELAHKEQLSGWVLIPSNDHAVYTISKHKDRLQPFYRTTIPDISVIEKIYDKSQLIELAEHLNVPVPKTHYFPDTELSFQPLNYPVLTKGKTGLTFYKALGRKAFLSKDRDELARHLKEIGKLFPLNMTFSQELIPYDGTNKTVSFTAFCDNGVIKTYWMGVKLREHPVQFGTATLTESVLIEECHRHARKLLQELCYTGVCEVEFLKDPRDGQYKLIEINARTWLWVGHAVACGINYPVYIYNYLNGIKQHYPSSYTLHVKWINPVTDLIFSIGAIIRGKTTLNNILKDSYGKKANALYEDSDKRPFFAYLWMMLNFYKRR